MYKKDYIKIADMFRRKSYEELFIYLTERFKNQNPRFDEVRFREAASFKTTIKTATLEDKFKEAYDVGLEHLIKLVKNTLKMNKSLDRFIMGMGTYFFVDKDNNNISLGESQMKMSKNKKEVFWVYELTKPSFKRLDEFLGQWDNVFKFSGGYTEIHSDGRIIEDIAGKKEKKYDR